MNKKSILFKSIALTSVFVLNMGLYLSLNKVAVELDAYSIADLPTTIDLNDCTNEEIRNYYSSLSSLDASERQGTNLLKNLKPILSNNQKYYSYDSGNKIWQIYEIADRDWEKSPASSTTYGTYNSVTNKITNYKYGSTSDGKNNPYVHALYINRDIENQTKAWGNHNQDAWGINREHIWAKSHGFDSTGNGGARGDPMHLWAANGWANHEHSNYFFAFVDKDRAYSDAGSKYKTAYNNLTGYSLNIGGNQTVFEPQDSDKGDIARSIFYMVARYNNYANAASGFDSDNPNLILLNNLSENTRTGTSSANDPYGMGLLSDLLAWNKLDPVDEYEIHRNNLLYKNYTNNRNPFIDFPSWADDIWGTADLDGKNYSSTPVSYAKPSVDPINTSGVADAFSISTSNLTMKVNDTAEIYGRDANSSISWTVSDNTVVNLDKNSSSNNEKVTVTALKSGSTTITATCGGDSVTCAVTVSNINYGTIENPLTVDEAIQVISVTGESATAQQLCVRGIVTSNSAYNTGYKNYDYVWLQNESGSNTQALQLFRIKADNTIIDAYGTEGSMVNKIVTAQGFGKYYESTTYEICKANNVQPYIKSVEEPAGPGVDDYLDNTSLYADLLAEEHDTRQDYENWKSFDEFGLENGAEITTFDFEKAEITFVENTGNNPPAYYTSDKSARVYKDNTITFTSSITITKIIFTFVSGYSSGLSTDVGTYSDGEWDGETSEVVFNVSDKVRITQIYIATIEGELTVDEVALRLGVKFNKADWNAIHDQWTITDYGVMIAKKETLNNTYDVDTIADAYDNGDYLLDLHKKSYAEPYSYNANNYLFTVKLKMTLQSNYNVTYCASPYIVAGGTYYFLDQIETSVNDLASELLASGTSSLSDDTLTLLSTLH